MRRTSVDSFVRCQGIRTASQSATVLAAERSAVDRDVVVEAWGVRQSVRTCCATVVAYEYIVGYRVSTVTVRRSRHEVFLDLQVRQVAACIIRDIGFTIIVSIQFSQVVKSLTRTTSRAVTRYRTWCVLVVATIG